MTYTCPMHPEVQQNSPGNCPKCGMALVETTTKKPAETTLQQSFFAQYKPLFTIVGLIVLVALVAAINPNTWRIDWLSFMQNWMAGFFIVFAGFKLLNVHGFAEGYSKYDLLAKYYKPYGLLYPFIELALGVAYILIPTNTYLQVFTLVLMVFSGLGVSIKLAKREKFQCACLGTFIDVPLTKVTLVEDFGMALMAAVMLFFT